MYVKEREILFFKTKLLITILYVFCLDWLMPFSNKMGI